MTRSHLWCHLRNYMTSLNTSNMPGVHHYTTKDGALGILETGRIWFTERAHLNDESEIRFGVTMAADLLGQHSELRAFKTSLIAEAENIFENFLFFSASFSFNNDCRSLWNRYADDGRGAILAFRASVFNDPSRYVTNLIPGNPNILVCPISYNTNILRAELEKIILSWDRENIAELCDHIFMISSMFKGPDWESEREYRFFVHADPQIIQNCDLLKTRQRSDAIIRYLDVPIQNWSCMNDFPIYRITLGPAATPDFVSQIDCVLAKKRLPIKADAIYKSRPQSCSFSGI